MNIPFFIAKRYLFSKKNKNAINIISVISIVVVAVSTAALIIVLSSINGFGKLIDQQISSFAPDLKIEVKEGKTFSIDSEKFRKIKDLKNVKHTLQILEDNVLLKYGNKQLICAVKGVQENYGKEFGLDSAVIYGSFKTHGNIHNFGVIGAGISYSLGISIESGESLSLWIPNRKSVQMLNPSQSFNKINLTPTGIITLDAEFDLKYILSSLETVRKFTDRDEHSVSSIEIIVKNEDEIKSLKKEIQAILGDEYYVKDLYEQYDVYKVMKSERLAAFIIMLFIILIASFSIIGSVTMLIIEKDQDIFTLLSMGANVRSVKKIFFMEGFMITIFGALIGIIFGALISFAQLKFGFVTFPSDGNYIIEAYPIELKVMDFVTTFISVTLIGTLISLYPASKIKIRMN